MSFKINKLTPAERREHMEDILDHNLAVLRNLIESPTNAGMGVAWTNVEKAQVALQRLAEYERTARNDTASGTPVVIADTDDTDTDTDGEPDANA